MCQTEKPYYSNCHLWIPTGLDVTSTFTDSNLGMPPGRDVTKTLKDMLTSQTVTSTCFVHYF